MKAHSLQLVLKNSEGSLTHKIPAYTPKILEIMKEYLDEDKIEYISEELICQYLVAMISILNAFFEYSGHQITGWLFNNSHQDTLISYIQQCLHFNPNMPGFLEEEEDDEEDQEEDDEDFGDDSSWKVRREILKFLVTLLGLSNKDFQKKVAKDAYTYIIKLLPFKDVYVQEFVLDYVEDLIPKAGHLFGESAQVHYKEIFEGIVKLISKNDETRIILIAIKIIRKMVHVSPNFSQANFDRIFAFSKQTLKQKSNDIDVLAGCLRLIEECISNSETAFFDNQLPQIFELTKTGISVCIVEAFNLWDATLKTLRITNLLQKYSHQIDEFSNLITLNLDSKKADLKIKERSIRSLGVLIGFRDTLNEARLKVILSELHKSCDNEVLLLESLQALEQFNVKSSKKFDINNEIAVIVEKLTDTLKNKRGIYQFGVIKVMSSLHSDRIITLNQAIKSNFVETLETQIKEDNLFLANQIAVFLTDQFEEYCSLVGFDSCLKKLTGIICNVSLDSDMIHKFVRVFCKYSSSGIHQEFIASLQQSLRREKSSRFEQTSLLFFNTLPPSDRESALSLICTEILKNSSASFLPFLLNVVSYLGASQSKEIALENNFIEFICESCSTQDTAIKRAANKAITGLFLGSPDSIVGVLQKRILGNVENRLFFFNSLVSLFDSLTHDISVENIDKVLDFLNTLIGTVQENEKSLTFTSIGKLLSKIPHKIEDRFKDYAKHNDILHAMLICVASRYNFKKDSQIEDYPFTVSSLIGFTFNENLEVKAEAFTALESIIHYHPSLFERLDDAFFTNMEKSMHFSKDNMIVVDMGQIKYRKDQGAPVRVRCHSLLLKLLSFKAFDCKLFVPAVLEGITDDEEDVTYSALKISSQIISDEDRVKHIASLKEELAVQISTASKAYLKGLSKILKEESVPFRCLELLLGILKRCVKHPEISKLQGIKDLYDQYKATDADYLLNKLV